MKYIFFILRKFTVHAYKIRGIGLGRFCELIRRVSAKYSSEQALLITDFRGQLSFHCFLKEHMGGQIFFRGSYSGDQLDLLERLLKPDSVFIDIGANQGEFTVAAGGIIKKGSVISFEPVSKFYKKLLSNIHINKFSNIKTFQIALADKEGMLPIYDSSDEFYDGTRHEGLPSLYVSDSRKNILASVEIKKLDDVLNELEIVKVDVIKLDIEGAEWVALKGAANTLARCRPILILEIGRETCQSAGYEPAAFAEWIIEQGYRIEKIVTGGQTHAIRPEQLVDFQNIVAYPV